MFVARYATFERRYRRDLPKPPLVRLRRQFHLSQRMFARRYGFPVETLRHWEQGTRKPSLAALAYLNVIYHRPLMVLKLLDNIERERGSGKDQHLWFGPRLNLGGAKLSEPP